jgi:hypothetical protein
MVITMLVGGKQVDKDNVWAALNTLSSGVEFAISDDIIKGLKNNLTNYDTVSPKGKNSQGNQR